MQRPFLNGDAFSRNISPPPDLLCSLNEVKVKNEFLSEQQPQVKQRNVKLAVHVDNVCKTYGGYGGDPVLHDFSMQVPSGTIYSLIGSSGCGKTTILSCISGLKSWDSGRISVLGLNQGSSSREFSEISKRIGFMPQELALYDHLTVKEIVGYYAKLYDLSEEEVHSRWRKLAKLLKLSSKRYVFIQDLSGGQKRRVSLALALVHTPQLLILDEPTVGLDPLLRKSIWEYLHELIITLKTTVLITTHYVEETRFSDTIGIMRNGRMLVEKSPEYILSTYKSDLLQDSILQICKIDDRIRNANISSTESLPQIADSSINEVTFQYKGKISPKSTIVLPKVKCKHDKVTICGYKEKDPEEYYTNSYLHYQTDNGKGTLIDIEADSYYYGSNFKRVKNFVRQSAIRTWSFSSIMWIFLLRQPIFAFILVFLPAVQLVMTFFVVGREPMDLKLGMINHEAMSISNQSVDDVCRNVSFAVKPCDLTLLSCHIQNIMFANKKLNMVSLNNKQTAEELVQDGSIFGYVTFPETYSESLVNRFMWGRFTADNRTFEESKIGLTLETSHYMAYHIILKQVFYALDTMSKNLELMCGFDQHNHEIPLHYREPIFGRMDGTHQESIIPAIVAQILFEILYGIAPMILIKDLKQGTFSRSNLAGLKFSEFMLGIFMTMGPILLIQSISCFLVLQFGFGFEVRGSIALFVLLCVLAGLCGQAFGIFVGILAKSEFTVIVSAIMVVPIIMTCSGTLWPLEAHPGYLMIIYQIFPSATIVSSMRSVINRGVGMTHALVWPGVVNCISWSVVFWLLSILGIRKMSKS